MSTLWIVSQWTYFALLFRKDKGKKQIKSIVYNMYCIEEPPHIYVSKRDKHEKQRETQKCNDNAKLKLE